MNEQHVLTREERLDLLTLEKAMQRFIQVLLVDKDDPKISFALEVWDAERGSAKFPVNQKLQ